MDWKVSEIFDPTPSPEEKAVTKMAITEWAEEDRPREKLMMHGPEALSTAELLAILIGGGSKDESAVDLMKRLLKDCNNNLAVLSKKTLKELMDYKGIGDAKAVSILAACELGKRREQSEAPKRPVMTDAKKMYELLWPKMRDLDVEESYAILMNQSFKLLECYKLSHGGLTETAVDVRMIIKRALEVNATIVALAHNHPSGNIHPSRDDDNLTRRVADACRVMRLHFADHIIVTDGDYYSYQENGKL